MSSVRVLAVLLPLGLVACAASGPRAPAPIEISAPARAAAAGVPAASAPAKTRGPEASKDAIGAGVPVEPAGAPKFPDGTPETSQRIYFDNAKAEINPASLPVIDAIAAAIKARPEVFPVVALDGHAAPNEHGPMRLSLARASAVRAALVARGVDGARLFERVSGATEPLCEHSRDICWERERRVEFAILHPSKPPEAEATPPESAVASAGDHPADVGSKCATGHETGDGAGEADACAEERPPARGPAPLEMLEQVRFGRGSAVLTPAALPALDLVAGFLKANPTALEIDGHAAPYERHSDELARARAEAVRAYLIACGVSAGGLIVRSQGSAKPACLERTSECRARNRRAELRFSDDAHP